MTDPRASASISPATLEKVRAFVHRRFPVAVSAGVTDEESLLDAGIIDSLGILDVVAFLEETFGITVGDEELTPEHFDSIASVTRFVAQKRGA